jgi:hypothetical protein
MGALRQPFRYIDRAAENLRQKRSTSRRPADGAGVAIDFVDLPVKQVAVFTRCTHIFHGHRRAARIR